MKEKEREKKPLFRQSMNRMAATGHICILLQWADVFTIQLFYEFDDFFIKK